MMNEATKQKLKKRLEDEQVVLEESLAKIATRNPSNPNDWVPAKGDSGEFGADRNDNSDIIEEMHDSNASLNELEGQLNLVRAALERLDSGAYGICAVGGEEIEIERLEANPSATTCKAHMR